MRVQQHDVAERLRLEQPQPARLLRAEKVGAGANGEVFAAEWRRSRVAVKRLLCHVEETSVHQFYCEMEILANARHDNIVRFLGGCVQPDNLCILFEFCPQSLYDLLRKAEQPLELQRVLSIARQVGTNPWPLDAMAQSPLISPSRAPFFGQQPVAARRDGPISP